MERELGQKEERVGDFGRALHFLFALFYLSPSRGFLRLPYRLLSLRNTVALYTTRLLSLKTLDQSYSSMSKTSRKLQMFTADNDALITPHVECNAKLETNLRVLRDSAGSWGY